MRSRPTGSIHDPVWKLEYWKWVFEERVEGAVDMKMASPTRHFSITRKIATDKFYEWIEKEAGFKVHNNDTLRVEHYHALVGLLHRRGLVE